MSGDYDRTYDGPIISGHRRINTALKVQSTAPTEPPSDAVFRPHHYARFIIEPLTFVNANKIGYNIGNVIKYACRYDAKNGLEDLMKARRYLDIQIETMARDTRVKSGENPVEVWKAVL